MQKRGVWGRKRCPSTRLLPRRSDNGSSKKYMRSGDAARGPPQAGELAQRWAASCCRRRGGPAHARNARGRSRFEYLSVSGPPAVGHGARRTQVGWRQEDRRHGPPGTDSRNCNTSCGKVKAASSQAGAAHVPMQAVPRCHGPQHASQPSPASAPPASSGTTAPCSTSIAFAAAALSQKCTNAKGLPLGTSTASAGEGRGEVGAVLWCHGR